MNNFTLYVRESKAMFNFYYDKYNSLEHADHKYIDKFFKNGRWNYVYKNPLKGLISTHEKVTSVNTGATFERTNKGPIKEVTPKPKKKGIFTTSTKLTSPASGKIYEKTDDGTFKETGTIPTVKRKKHGIFTTEARSYSIDDPRSGFKKVELPKAYKNALEANNKGIKQTEYYRRQLNQQKLDANKKRRLAQKEASKSRIEKIKDKTISGLNSARSIGRKKVSDILSFLKR